MQNQARSMAGMQQASVGPMPLQAQQVPRQAQDAIVGQQALGRFRDRGNSLREVMC